MDEIKIDDHIPIPVPVYFKDSMEALKVGESFEFPHMNRASVQTVASNLKKTTGKVFTIKRTSEFTCRIWRKS